MELSPAGINNVDFRTLKDVGVEALVFDLDNTISAPYANQVDPRVMVCVSRSTHRLNCAETMGDSETGVRAGQYCDLLELRWIPEV
jgi:ethanolamine utilization microcompartment shell protein EutL